MSKMHKSKKNQDPKPPFVILIWCQCPLYMYCSILHQVYVDRTACTNLKKCDVSFYFTKSGVIALRNYQENVTKTVRGSRQEESSKGRLAKDSLTLFKR